MNSRILIPNIFRAIGLVLLQVLVLNKINLHGWINPYVYPLFILLLPFRIPHWVLLLFAFGMGLTIELFTYNYGIHAAACVLMAFIRPAIIAMFSSHNQFEHVISPNLKFLGFRFFISYISIAIFIHHFVLFFIDSIGGFHLLEFIIRVLMSSLFSVILILLVEYLFMSGEEHKS